MNTAVRHQWHIFWLTCGVTFMLLMAYLFPLLPIYVDAGLRSRAQAIIQVTAAREGWLSSGLSIRHIDDDSVTLLYRTYMRGADSVRCFAIDLHTGSLQSCDS